MVEVPSYTCSHCGGANPAFAQNCQWCGASLLQPALSFPTSGPPLRSDPVPEPSDYDESEPEHQPGIPFLVRGFAFVIMVIIISAVALSQSSSPQNVSSGTPLPSGPAYPVNVTVIRLSSSDDICGLNGAIERGFLGVSNEFSGKTWQISGTPAGCTVNGITATTEGFQVISLDIPISIPPGQTAAVSVSFSMSSLSGPYTGTLNISVS
jgi:hypothetical protein